MGKAFVILLFMVIVAALFAVMDSDQVSDYWLGYIQNQAKQHNPKLDPWVQQNQLKVGQYCQLIGNKPRAIVIYNDILEKVPNTLESQIAEFHLGECYEAGLNYVAARDHYSNCINNYEDLKETEWALKAKERLAAVISGRI